MAVALDTEREILRTITQDDACRRYMEEGIYEFHFADKLCQRIFKWAMEYFSTHGSMQQAPSIDVIRTEFPEYDQAISETKGTSPSYLVTRLRNEYIRRQSEDMLQLILPMMGEDPMGCITALRDSASGIVENCKSEQYSLEYGKDMEAYRRRLAEQRAIEGVPYPFQEMTNWTGGIRPGELSILVAPPSTGKAQPLSSKILTDSGWVEMGKLSVGDSVKTRSGKSARVSGIFPQGKLDVYEVEFSDGRKMRCSDEHIFTVKYKGKQKGKSKYKERDITVREMLDAGIIDERNGHKSAKWYVPLSEPMDFPEREHVIDPYLLGVLIGDGCLTCDGVVFSQNEDDVVKKVSKLIDANYIVKKINSDNYNYSISKVCGGRGTNKIRAELKRLGLLVRSTQRFIPDEYMFDSASNRMKLMMGLFDTDGSISKDGSFSYSTKSKRLSDDICSLARGMGYKSRVKTFDRTSKGKGVEYEIAIITDDVIFSSNKHLERYESHYSKVGHRNTSLNRIAIRSIRNLGYKEEMQCIMIDDADHLYITDEYCMTHNTVLACKMALEAKQKGYNVFFASLELTVENIAQRIEYMQVNRDSVRVPISDYQQGARLPQYEQAIMTAQDEIADMPGKLFISQPRVEDRTPTALVQACKANGCNLLIVDQLQFVQKPRRDSLQESYGAALQEFKQQIMTPADGVRIPLFLLHQMNRGGAKVQKEGTGRVGSMTDIAGSAWVEQIADIVWGIGRNDEERNNNVMNIATLKARNVEPVGWRLSWDTNYAYQFDVMRDESESPIRLSEW